MKTKSLTVQEKEAQVFEKMKDTFHFKNRMSAFKLVNVVINVGIGSALKKDKNKADLISDRLAKITGQKPTIKGAKKSIASFKIRQGDPVGTVVTLRGKRMRSFLEKLINVVLPRTKDFRGINLSTLDNLGNLNLGIKEHTIFPETINEDIRDIFGMAITVVSTAHNKKEARAFFEFLGIPFKKEVEKKK
jgi:large subunit ribosomal protein L5